MSSNNFIICPYCGNYVNASLSHCAVCGKEIPMELKGTPNVNNEPKNILKQNIIRTILFASSIVAVIVIVGVVLTIRFYDEKKQSNLTQPDFHTTVIAESLSEDEKESSSGETREYITKTDISAETQDETVEETEKQSETQTVTKVEIVSTAQEAIKPTKPQIEETTQEILTEPTTEAATEAATETTKPAKPQIEETTQEISDIIYVPPYDYEIPTEPTTETATEAQHEIYTVNVNFYKEVNGVKTYVKTLTVSGEERTLFEIPLTLQEDTRCKIADRAGDITGVYVWEKDTYKIAYTGDEYLNGYIEDGVLKSEIRNNNDFDITYFYREAKVNVVLYDEDYNYQTVDTYTISGGLGDTFTVDMVYPDQPIYELYSVAGYGNEENTTFRLSNASYINEYKVGDTTYSEQVFIPGTYAFNGTFFKEGIYEVEIQYFGYIYSKPVFDSIIKDGMSEYDKAKAIHDWIVNNCYYDFNLDYGFESFTPYGIFKNRYAVCDGYTYGFRHLAIWAGLECERYTAGNHSWNRVKVDGEWYNVDCTYSDNEGMFFLKSDAYFVEMGHHSGFVADGVCNSTKYE